MVCTQAAPCSGRESHLPAQTLPQPLVSCLKSLRAEILKVRDARHRCCLPGTCDLLYHVNLKPSYRPPQKLSGSENCNSKAITIK